VTAAIKMKLARGSCARYILHMTEQPKIDTLLALPADRRWEIVEALWNSLTSDPAGVPIPDWHREVVTQRLVEDDEEAEDETTGESWENVRRRIESR
jgi:putative addiction module component (TIGR02574 family)